MKASKKVIAKLEKCYSVAPLGEGFLVASEKAFPCLLFKPDGTFAEQIWAEPGGTMSIVQSPATGDAFLATHRFYSPNNSKQASIVLCVRAGTGWKVKTLAELPHVHRFDILKHNGEGYLLACTLMDRRDIQDDWSYPGKVYACRLSESHLDVDSPDRLSLEVVCEGLLKNHGYCRTLYKGIESGAVTCDDGAFIFTPPLNDGLWIVNRILEDPISDLVFADLDDDGEDEIAAIIGFHGDVLRIYKKTGTGGYAAVYEYPEKLEFLHALATARVAGQEYVFAGNRKGAQLIVALSFDQNANAFVAQTLAENAGSANLMPILVDGRQALVSANREKDEVVLYTF